ncbi:MAG: hypothetical protein MZV64_05085 [Ignavibacteriales bacterium]|nr:hypothetical protein [Ignavibacteriales bacterium]
MTPIVGEAAPDPRHRGVPRPHLERQVDEHGRLLAGRHRQHRRPGAPTPSSTGHYALVNLLYYAGAERDARAASSSGASARTSRDGFTSDDVKHPVLVQVQLLAHAWRQDDDTRHRIRPLACVAVAAFALALVLALAGAGARRRPTSRSAAGRGVRQVQGPAGRQERRLHPGARQGRPEHLRDRRRHRRRQGLHRGRRQVRGLDPVDLEGLHHGAGHRRSRDPTRSRTRIGVDATGTRFNSIVAIEGSRRGRRRRAGDEPAGQPGRHLGHQHGHGRDRRRGLERRSSATTTTSPGGR